MEQQPTPDAPRPLGRLEAMDEIRRIIEPFKRRSDRIALLMMILGELVAAWREPAVGKEEKVEDKPTAGQGDSPA